MCPDNRLVVHPQGFLVVRRFNKDKNIILIQDCYVKPEFRRKGYASSWIEELQKEFKDKKILTIVLMDSETSHISIISQIKAGFKIIKSTDDEVYLEYVGKYAV